MKYKKTKEDLSKHLRTQIKFLELSSKAYDDGFEDEAQRLATTIRVMLHDTNSSTSLFSHLRIKNDVSFLSSTSQYIPINEAPYLAFLTLRMTNGIGAEYIPNCNVDNTSPNKWYKFDDWWNEIIFDDKKNLFTRKDIILNVSNKDGGAHIDESLNEKYAGLTKSNTLNWEYHFNDEAKPFDNNPAYAAIRQIAHELMMTCNYIFSIKSYTRTRSDKEICFNFIDEKLYAYEDKKGDEIHLCFFKDERVTNKQVMRSYIDNLLFNDGSKVNRFLVL